MLHACTYFDARYLTRGLALYRSLERQSASFTLWMLCLDQESLFLLQKMALPHAQLISNAQLQMHFPALKAAQGNRSTFEYYATIKAFEIRMIFERHSEVDRLFFLDADFFFYGDPQLLANELGSSAVLLSLHRLTPTPPGAKSGHHGEFNAGFVAFQRSKGGVEPLQWWCERVLEWCRDEVQGELFADQGYLTVMAREFPGVKISRDPGVNVAPWNLDERQNARIIFVHFHGLRRLGYLFYDTGTPPYRVQPTSAQIRTLYRPYIRELKEIVRWLRKEYGYDPPEGSVRHPTVPIARSPLLLLSRLRRRQWLLSPVY